MPLLRISPEKVIEIPCTLFSSSTVELHLENVSEHPFVAYKIKTTAPKSYLVRPSTGVVPQGETRSIQIVLQAFNEDPPRTSTDRFLVQATHVESSMPLPRNYWLSLPKEDVEETRLNVVFKRTNASPGGPTVGAPGESGGGAPEGPGSSSATIPAATAPAGSSSSSNSGVSDLKQQYDQLIEYALAMERHKEELTRENEALKQQLEARGSRSLAELWHLPVYLFVFVMAWYLLDRAFGGTSSKP